MDDAANDLEVDVEAAASPGEDRIPPLRLEFDEAVGPVGAVAEEVALPISGEAGGEAIGVRSDPVYRGIGKAGQGHRSRVDLLPLRLPFLRDSPAPTLGRPAERIPGGCLHRAVVDQDLELALSSSEETRVGKECVRPCSIRGW